MQQIEHVTIHLISARTRRQLEIRDAALRGAKDKGVEPPKFPPIDFDGFSGRGVRMRILDPAEKDSMLAIAAALVGQDGTLQQLQMTRNTESVKRSLVAVTRSDELETLDGAEWEQLNDAKLAGMPGFEKLSFGRLFTAKDVQTMRALFVRWHDATDQDLDEIEGKAVRTISG